MWRPVAAALLCSGLTLLPGCGGAASPSTPPAPRKAAASDSTQPLSDQTGSIDSLRGSTLNQRHAQDIGEMLQGRVPGLQVIRLPNGDLTLRIRGGDPSLDSTNSNGVQGYEPLLVLDGMPVSEGQLSNTLRALDPNNVDKVEVLKDVSSTSMYGMRGAHGVVVITLKHD